MDSTDRIDNIEQLSGNEPEERENENLNSDSKIDIFTGDEFEKPGREETEPVSAIEQSSGNENAASGSQVNIVTGEMFEGSGEQETEPDPAPERPPGNLSKEQRGKEIEPNSKKGNHPVRPRNYRAKGKLYLLIAMGISLFLGIGSICIKYDIFDLNTKQLELVPERQIFPIPKGETIAFDSFIIPFKENKRFTYISLSIVFSLPNIELRKEMSRKRDRIRGILYDMFIDEMNRAYRIPPIDHLKKSIIRTINRALTVGMVKEVFVTQFLAV